MKTLRYLLLVGLIVLSILPMATVGAKDRSPSTVSANMFITGLDEGNVRPVGNYPNGKYFWQVRNRTLSGNIVGDLNGTCSFTYDGKLNPDQSGPIEGTLTIKESDGQVSGPLTYKLTAPQPVGAVLVGADPTQPSNWRGVGMMTINNLQIRLVNGKGDLKGFHARGVLNGVVFIQMTLDGAHVERVLTGQTVLNPYTRQVVIPSAVSVLNLSGNLIREADDNNNNNKDNGKDKDKD